MDFLSGEINKLKRKAPEDTSSKYIRRGDLEAKRQQEYFEEQKRLKGDREARERDKLARLEDFEAKKRAKESTRVIKSSVNKTVDLTQVKQELKELNEPIHLFGEEDEEIRQRWQKVKAKHQRLASSTSALLHEVYSDLTDEGLPGSDQELEILSAWAKSDEDKRRLQDNLFLVFRLYIRDWGRASSSDDDAGNQRLYSAAREHLARLLLRLKAGNLPTDILRNLSNVARGLMQKDYTAANHAYLQMSIGKAAWPVGVTMVGIHERAQRERVKQVADSAHILADEVTRQWLQSLKRLITHRERTYPA